MGESRWCWFVVLAALPLLCGCLYLPPPPFPHPQTRHVTAPAAQADSTAAAQQEAEAQSHRQQASSIRAPETQTPATQAAELETPASESSAPADSIPQIVIQLSPEEEAQLIAQADEDLKITRERLDQLNEPTLTTDEAERLAAVRELLDSAGNARMRGDIRSAAMLTQKARILAEGLPKE